MALVFWVLFGRSELLGGMESEREHCATPVRRRVMQHLDELTLLGVLPSPTYPVVLSTSSSSSFPIAPTTAALASVRTPKIGLFH